VRCPGVARPALLVDRQRHLVKGRASGDPARGDVAVAVAVSGCPSPAPSSGSSGSSGTGAGPLQSCLLQAGKRTRCNSRQCRVPSQVPSACWQGFCTGPAPRFASLPMQAGSHVVVALGCGGVVLTQRIRRVSRPSETGAAPLRTCPGRTGKWPTVVHRAVPGWPPPRPSGARQASGAGQRLSDLALRFQAAGQVVVTEGSIGMSLPSA